MLLSAIYVVGGLVLLAVAGEYFVRSAASIAIGLSISPLIIGLTIVAFGTSLPELSVSLSSALAGQPDIAVGNVIGSNIANVLLVLGAAAVISPFVTETTNIMRNSVVMIGATVFVCGLAMMGEVPRLAGGAMIIALIIYVVVTIRADRNAASTAETDIDDQVMAGGTVTHTLVLMASLAAIVWGASLLIDGAVFFARLLGVSEAVIGLTMVAVGTSLPELVVSVIAAWRGHSAVAVGNVVGSNIFNILLILGFTASITPLPMAAEISNRDVWVMLVSSLMLVFFLRSGGRLTRLEGAIALMCYGLYVTVLYYGMG